MEDKSKGNRRRGEGAKKLRSEVPINAKVSDDGCDEMPIVRVKPPRHRKRVKEPIFEEDIIDGFAVMSFRSFEELERCVRAAEKTSSRGLDPFPERIKCSSRPKRRSTLPKAVPGSRYTTEEEGYICDRESEGDKVSDADDSMFYSPGIGSADTKPISALSRSTAMVDKQHASIPVTLCATSIPSSIRSDNSIATRTDSFYTSPMTTVATVATCSVVATTSTIDCPKITIREEPNFNCQAPNLFEPKSTEVKPDLSSCRAYEDKKPLFPDQKYPLVDQKPIIDSKPVLFSPINPCPQSTYNNSSLFRPHFNTITATSAAPTSSTVTTTSTSSIASSVPHPTVNHSAPVIQSSVSSEGRFSVSSLVSGTNSNGPDYLASRVTPPVGPMVPSPLSRHPSVKPYPTTKPSIASPVVSKMHSGPPQILSKSPHLPMKSPSSFASSNMFANMCSTYGPSHSPLVPASLPYSPFPPGSKPPPISAYSSSPRHDPVKLEPPEYGGKPSPKLSPKVTPPHIFGPLTGQPSSFGVPCTVSPHLKGALPSFGGVVGREPSNATPPRPTTPHSGFAQRYSHRPPDPHMYNSSPSGLGNSLSNFPRTGAPASFPIPSTPISAPLPPSAIFAPHPAAPSSNAIGQDPLAQADLLRRELDSRFLATQDRSGVGMSATGLGSIGAVPTLLRTDVHHHQHQHTHVHQHLLPQLPPPPPLAPPLLPQAPSGIFSHSSATPSLFKEVSKVGMESGICHQRSGIGTFSSGLSPLMPPSSTAPLVSSAAPKKNGRWNMMHVRIAWEIFYDQQKQSGAKGVKLGSSDILRGGPGMPGTPSLYSSLSRPGDQLGSMLSHGNPSHRLEGSFLGTPHITPSMPEFRYAPQHNSAFPSPNIGGPTPGSMFSRESSLSALSMPTPVQDPWRIRAPFSNASGATWQHKRDSSYFDNERREQEERERRERQEKERKERERREEQERRERDEKEKRDREERERREREEKQRERDKRAEHEKERLARLDAYNERAHRRDESRSPLRLESKEAHLAAGLHGRSAGCKYDSNKDEITIVGSKEGTRQAHPPPPGLLGPPVLPSQASSFLGAHSSSLERARLLGPAYHVPPANPPPIAHHWADPLRDPYRGAMASTHDPFAVARAHDFAARESLLQSRDHLLRDPLRDSLDRAREEHLMRVNPLGTMILNERYREHQVAREHQAAREMIERERHYRAAASSVPGGLYPHPAMLPPAVSAVMPPTLKTGSPLGHPHIVPHPHSLGALYSAPHLGHPPLVSALAPPLIPSLAGPALCRPPDKKDLPK